MLKKAKFKSSAALGEIPVEILSDAGSTPAISTITIRPKSTRGAIRKAGFTQAKPKRAKVRFASSANVKI